MGFTKRQKRILWICGIVYASGLLAPFMLRDYLPVYVEVGMISLAVIAILTTFVTIWVAIERKAKYDSMR